MKLWFQQSNGNRRLIGEFETEQEAVKAIHEFCDERNFHIYYTRIWVADGEKWFDVGSHTEYFCLGLEANK